MRCHLAVLAAVVALGVSAGGVSPQIIRFDPRSGQAGAGYEGIWRELETGARFRSQFYREWVELPFTGVLLNPRIFHYSLKLSPFFSQQDASGYDNPFTTRNIFVHFGGTLFQAGRTPIALTASRNSGTWRGGLTAGRDFSESLTRAALWYNNRWLPLRVSVERRSVRSTWSLTGGVPIRQDQSERGFIATASNSKLTLRFEQRWLDDRVVEQGYSTQTRSAVHTFRWGKGSRLISLLETFSRTGFGKYDRSEWREQLHIQHAREAASDVAYSARRTEAGGGSVRERSWSASSQAGLRWLLLSVGGNSSSVTFQGGRTTRQSLLPAAALSLELPAGIHFRASGFSGIETLTVEAEADGLIDVVDERHQVPDLRSFFLDKRFIDPATVVVRSEDQTITYILDRDYRLIGAGSLLRLVVSAGSRIQTGDVLLVSYRYRLVGEGRERARKTGYDVGLRLAGFTARRSEQWRSVNMDQDDGSTGLFDMYDAVTAVAMQEATPVGRFLLEASRSKRRGPGYADVTDELRANHTAVIGAAIRTDLSASASRARGEVAEITAVYGSGGVGVRFAPNLGATARIDAWRFRRNGALVEGTVIGAVDMDWRFGSVETEWRFEHIRRENGPSGRENRFSVRMVRRF